MAGDVGSDSLLTSPSTSSIDLAENLHDLRFHSVCRVENLNHVPQVTAPSDPNANGPAPPPPSGVSDTGGVNSTAQLVANVNYSRQDSGNTLVNEDLDRSAELEWDEDVSPTHVPSAVTLEDDGVVSKTNGATLLPAV